MARILVVEPVAQAGIDRLATAHEIDVRLGLTRDQLLAALREPPGWDALIVRSQTRVDAQALQAAAPRLSIVGVASIGTDKIDLEAATRAGVMVVNAPTGNTIAAAEQTMAVMLALLRKVPAADASVRRGEWDRSAYTGSELRGRTLGIIGLGKIGKTNELDDGPVKVDSFKVIDSQPGKALVEVILHEGRKHVVRRMLEAVGHPVLELVRTEVGPIRLADLKSGRTRRLNKAEIGALYKAADL